MNNKVSININGVDVEIILTTEQVAQITQATKPKLFEYDDYNTWYIESEKIRQVSYPTSYNCIKYGRYRRTKEQAEMDFKRQTRMMRLAALAWEVGECVEFVPDKENWYVYKFEGIFKASFTDASFEYDKVYMTEKTAVKVCEILNSGEYSLDVE